jgi:hypothetical protein
LLWHLDKGALGAGPLSEAAFPDNPQARHSTKGLKRIQEWRVSEKPDVPERGNGERPAASDAGTEHTECRLLRRVLPLRRNGRSRPKSGHS